MVQHAVLRVLLAAASVAGSAAFAQSSSMPQWQAMAGGKMAFDVASVKPTAPGTSLRPNIPLDNMDRFTPTGGLFSADATVEAYIEFAYKLFLAPEQKSVVLAQMPKPLATQHFTITARAAGDPTKDQYRLMMQSLLANRFKLAVHFEKRDMPVLALVLVKPGTPGPFLRATADGPPCNAPIATGKVGDSMPTPASGVSAGWSAGWPYECGAMTIIPRPDSMVLWGLRGCPISCIGDWLANLPPKNLGAPVVDETGLSGKFDLALEWVYIPPSSGAPPAATGTPLADLPGPTLEEALEKQLGLKLKPGHALVDTLVLDHVEMPSEN